MLSFFPRYVLDGILDLIGSVSEGLLLTFLICSLLIHTELLCCGIDNLGRFSYSYFICFCFFYHIVRMLTIVLQFSL